MSTKPGLCNQPLGVMHSASDNDDSASLHDIYVLDTKMVVVLALAWLQRAERARRVKADESWSFGQLRQVCALRRQPHSDWSGGFSAHSRP